MPFKDGVVSPELLMEDVEFTMGWRERLTYAALQRDDWRCLMSVFSTTDRVQCSSVGREFAEPPSKLGYVVTRADEAIHIG